MNVTFRIGAIATLLLAVIPFTRNAASRSLPALDADPQTASAHLSGLTAKITTRDGATRTVKLEGVGCPLSICSRTAIKAKTGADRVVRSWFDCLAAITDTTPNDALFISKDGTRQRLSLIKDFRVLYLANRLGGTEKLDLARVKTVEFLAPAR
jgi:hypothetical protein